MTDVQSTDPVTAYRTAINLLAAQGGSNVGTTLRRGKSIIATAEARTNEAYGLLTTPDRVQNVVLPTDGLLFVLFQAQMKATTPQGGHAAIFLGSNQVKVQNNVWGGPAAQGARTGLDINVWNAVSTCGAGLVAMQKSTTADQGTDVTTGQVVGAIDTGTNDLVYDAAGAGPVAVPENTPVGGACAIFAAAGTYDVSVQFQAEESTTVTARNRKLWVWTLGF